MPASSFPACCPSATPRWCWSSADGGFGSLAEVALLFQTPGVLLAGWVHYLAFDLLVGGWIVRIARSDEVPFWQVVPLLGLTFLFGPAGYLAFQTLRIARGRFSPAL
jgi:Domain of unknown function (DUF4281)